MGEITRRNFINGTLVAAGSSMLAHEVQAQQQADAPALYPPELTGLRGSHPGSNTHAHDKAWGRRSDFGTPTDLEEAYDLVVVGGGLSGLAAAHFFRRKHGDGAKILVLDNHDDFGGHAKRNEHTVDGKLRIGYGGSQTLVEPGEAGKRGSEPVAGRGRRPEAFRDRLRLGLLSPARAVGPDLLRQGHLWCRPGCAASLLQLPQLYRRPSAGKTLERGGGAAGAVE